MAFDENINTSVGSYLTQDYEKVKNYHRLNFLASKIEKYSPSFQTLIDLGCAKGEFLYKLSEVYPNSHLSGIDIDHDLIKLAQSCKQMAKVDFTQCDLLDYEPAVEFDVAVLSGVLSIFDDPELILSKMVASIKVGCFGYIFGGFCDDDIDVLVRYRNNWACSNKWESGWNMFSLYTIKKILHSNCKILNIENFILPENLNKSEDPVASFSHELADGQRIVVTGGNVVRNFKCIVFERLK